MSSNYYGLLFPEGLREVCGIGYLVYVWNAGCPNHPACLIF